MQCSVLKTPSVGIAAEGRLLVVNDCAKNDNWPCFQEEELLVVRRNEKGEHTQALATTVIACFALGGLGQAGLGLSILVTREAAVESDGCANCTRDPGVRII